MCGIAGVFNLRREQIPGLSHFIDVMNDLQKHRGPDGVGKWMNEKEYVAFGHRRLSIIDLQTGDQPMKDEAGNVICFNGEIYNYIELKNELKGYSFKTNSDTEVILAAYLKWGDDCVTHLRGMFSFSIWDKKNQKLFCARDRFGIKPFYYTEIDKTLYFASEAKALLPFIPEIKTNTDALKDYLVFQLCLDGKTLFKDIHELKPGHSLSISNGHVEIKKYWEVYYEIDFDHTPKYFQEHLRELIYDSVKYHMRSDVPVGSYLSGGLDSSIITSVASDFDPNSKFNSFTGKFDYGHLFDESEYARSLAEMKDLNLREISLTSSDFLDSIKNVIYHLDYPVAGPGSFPQYHVSKLAAQHNKVVLGGQGGDEVFAGYARYLIAYFEQCIKGAIDGTLNSGNFVVTYESIIPNLANLKNYKPLIKQFWSQGLFEEHDKRYFDLINRSGSLKNEIVWDVLEDYSAFETFSNIFNQENVGREAYLDKMTHFDFKTLLPGLLHIEDRMSMAHGLESRVPFLDNPLVEFVATMPADVKFQNGTMKRVLLKTMKDVLPKKIVKRKNKMGFPVPLNDWLKTELKDFVPDTFNSQKLKDREYFNKDAILDAVSNETQFGRKTWGLLSLELWHQEFHDNETKYKNLIKR